MTTQRITIGDGGTGPVACTLTPAGLAARTGRWERLAARAMTGRAQTTDGLRLRFRPGPGVEEELRALVALETECCPWADWVVETGAREVVLDVRAPGRRASPPCTACSPICSPPRIRPLVSAATSARGQRR